MNDKLRIFIRKILVIKENETILDGIQRHKFHFLKKIPFKKVEKEIFEKNLKDLGVGNADVIIVHCSWRGMYALDASPEWVINELIRCVGKEGTVLMPCFGDNDGYFSLQNTKSQAGVLSEIFRKKRGVYRSVFPKFSMVGYGKNAEDILKTHVDSRYQFDEQSPYYRAVKEYHAKILLLGMGKNPHKISVFHCASYAARLVDKFYAQCYTRKKVARIVIDSNSEREIEYIDRQNMYVNDRNVFKKLLKKVHSKSIIRRGYSLMLFDAEEAFNAAYSFCSNHGCIYKKR